MTAILPRYDITLDYVLLKLLIHSLMLMLLTGFLAVLFD
jgi:hypothetical protein